MWDPENSFLFVNKKRTKKIFTTTFLQYGYQTYLFQQKD